MNSATAVNRSTVPEIRKIKNIVMNSMYDALRLVMRLVSHLARDQSANDPEEQEAAADSHEQRDEVHSARAFYIKIAQAR